MDFTYYIRLLGKRIVTGINLDYFIGILFADWPYFSEEIYKSDVADLKAQASLNISSIFLFEVEDIMRYEVQMEFVPFIGTLGIDLYTTSTLQDNCFWMYYGYHVMQYNVRLTQNIAQCEVNLKDSILESDSILGLPNYIT